MHVTRAVERVDLPRHVAHVIALIGVGRKEDADAAQFQVAQPGGQRQDVHLPAGIVDVILAGDTIAGGIENIREARAERCAAPVADMQRAGGIRRNELEQHALPLAVVAASERAAGIQHLADDLLFRARPQHQIDESRACDLRPQHVRRRGQCREQRLREVAGIAAHRLSELQRQVARVVAMTRLLRTLEDDRRGCSLRIQLRVSGAKQLGEMRLQVGEYRLVHGARSEEAALYPYRRVRPGDGGAQRSSGSTSSAQRTPRPASAPSDGYQASRKRCSRDRRGDCTSNWARSRPATLGRAAATGS